MARFDYRDSAGAPAVPCARDSWNLHHAEPWSRQLRDRAVAWAWRILHPAVRESFDRGVTLAPLRALACPEGLPLRVLEERPGSSGVPVVLAPTAGMGSDCFRYGGEAALAERLRRLGFRVYLLGDAASLGEAAITFDELVRTRVGHVLETVCHDAGAQAAHWVGHGLGGQLGIAWASWGAGERLASLAVVGAPVVFPSVSSRHAAALSALSWLPSGWSVPIPKVGTLMAVREGGGQTSGEGAHRRGVMRHTMSKVPVGLVRSAHRWLQNGALTSDDGMLDYLPGVEGTDVPLFWAAGRGDVLCPPEWMRPLDEVWGGTVMSRVLESGDDHLGLLSSEASIRQLHEPLGDWLVKHEERAWLDSREWDIPEAVEVDTRCSLGSTFRRRLDGYA